MTVPLSFLLTFCSPWPWIPFSWWTWACSPHSSVQHQFAPTPALIPSALFLLLGSFLPHVPLSKALPPPTDQCCLPRGTDPDPGLPHHSSVIANAIPSMPGISSQILTSAQGQASGQSQVEGWGSWRCWLWGRGRTGS